MNDMRTKQWFVKIHYNNVLIEVREIWSDTQSMAQIYAHRLATSSLDTQVEEPDETELRIKRLELARLIKEKDELQEFIYDDYGDTVEQLGKEMTEAMERKYKRLGEDIEQLRSRASDLEIELMPCPEPLL